MPKYIITLFCIPVVKSAGHNFIIICSYWSSVRTFYILDYVFIIFYKQTALCTLITNWTVGQYRRWRSRVMFLLMSCQQIKAKGNLVKKIIHYLCIAGNKIYIQLHKEIILYWSLLVVVYITSWALRAQTPWNLVVLSFVQIFNLHLKIQNVILNHENTP
jgi:hypothetical protein